MNEKLICSRCNKKATYREKDETLFCVEHHLKGRKASYKTYADGTTYIKCPHCNCGDTCGTDGC